MSWPKGVGMPDYFLSGQKHGAGFGAENKPAECHDDRAHYARGLCLPCYRRYRRAGTTQLIESAWHTNLTQTALKILAKTRLSEYR